MINKLRSEALKHGDMLSAIPTDRLKDVKNDFDIRGIDTSPYYDFEPRLNLGFNAISVLVVASPSQTVSVSFDVDGIKKSVLIPATYIDYNERKESVKRYLSELLKEYNFNIAPGHSLPCKPIAVHAGLGALGRNNTVIVDKMGSLVNINLFFTDVPCYNDNFYPLRLSDGCEGCNKCIKGCPTSALTYDKELINADRCLTMLNESEGEFPDWINPDWHNALIGCSKCQSVCPQNNWNVSHEIASFDKDSTRAFINGVVDASKMSDLGYFTKVLPRNLKALLAQDTLA